MARRTSLALLAVLAVYLGLGLAFHLKWQSALAACRQMREAQGGFVEPEVFGGVLGLALDVTGWPVYVWANVYQDGTPFATRCTHAREVSTGGEEEAVRYVVESFGRRLQNVSLQSPNAAQLIREQYAEFVAPELLETWAADVSMAPGRVVSSPWPDRIEITDLAKEGPDRYVVTGFVVEVTSVEVVSGGAAVRIPVHIAVEKEGGRWLITEYIEER